MKTWDEIKRQHYTEEEIMSMKKEAVMEIKKDAILQWCEDKDIEAEDLDGLIHDIKLKEAAEINNKGLEGQLDFLDGEYGDDLLHALEVLFKEE